MAKWGYIPLDEMRSPWLPGGLKIDCDLYWKVRPAIEVEKISWCHHHWPAG